jgi:hypothetical protein
MRTNAHVRLFLLIICAAITCLAFAPVALAGKGGAGGGGGGPKGGSTTNGTIELVLVDSPDSVANWGEQVRFNVSTTATDQPHVDLNCYQGGTLVYSATTGYYASYPWPWTQTFTLSSQSWTGGDADCTAVLYKLANSGAKTTLNSLSFHAYA